jgi:hypothetical protein
VLGRQTKKVLELLLVLRQLVQLVEHQALSQNLELLLR